MNTAKQCKITFVFESRVRAVIVVTTMTAEVDEAGLPCRASHVKFFVPDPGIFVELSL